MLRHLVFERCAHFSCRELVTSSCVCMPSFSCPVYEGAAFTTILGTWTPRLVLSSGMAPSPTPLLVGPVSDSGARPLITRRLMAFVQRFVLPKLTVGGNLRAGSGILARSLGNLEGGCSPISSSRYGAHDCRRRLSGRKSSWFRSVPSAFSLAALHERDLNQRSGVKSQLRRTRSMCASTVSDNVVVNVPISVEETTVVDSEVEALLEQLDKDAPQAVQLAIEGLEEAEGTKEIELSVLLCNDSYIQGLNKEWRGKDSATDVLSFSQDQRAGLSPIWLLGDVVISLETACRQADERGHTVLDETRILLVHGLLHLLGYDHELGDQESEEMENEEKRILNGLGWKGDGLISSAPPAPRGEEEADEGSSPGGTEHLGG